MFKIIVDKKFLTIPLTRHINIVKTDLYQIKPHKNCNLFLTRSGYRSFFLDNASSESDFLPSQQGGAVNWLISNQTLHCNINIHWRGIEGEREPTLDHDHDQIQDLYRKQFIEPWPLVKIEAWRHTHRITGYGYLVQHYLASACELINAE